MSFSFELEKTKKQIFFLCILFFFNKFHSSYFKKIREREKKS